MALSIIALVIAGLSLLVAAGAMVVSWRSYKHNKERDTRLDERSVIVTCSKLVASLVKVPGSQTPILDLRNPEGHPTHTYIEVRAFNNGHRPTGLLGARFQASDGRLITPIPIQGMSTQLPKHLADGESVTLYYDWYDLDRMATEEAATVTHAIVYDASGVGHTAPYPV